MENTSLKGLIYDIVRPADTKEFPLKPKSEVAADIINELELSV